MRANHKARGAVGLALIASLAAALACARPDLASDFGVTPIGGGTLPFTDGTPAAGYVPGAGISPARPTRDISRSPTPDPPRTSALDRQVVETYSVQRNDTLNQIGSRYGVTAEQIAAANGLKVTDVLYVGQVLLIPLPDQSAVGPAVKLLPDSEFVYGPNEAGFDLAGFVRGQGGFLAAYTETVPGVYLDGAGPGATFTGAEIVRLVAARYSVSTRLLLAVLENQSGWVTLPEPGDHTLAYPLGRVEVNREGLFRQLSWAANELNRGYYGWRAGWLISFTFDAGGLRVIEPGLNAGTVGVQNLFARLLTVEAWTRAMSPGGFSAAYARLFGNPFAYAVEPLTPPDLTQPALALPFEPGKTWAFTGGPHGGWDTGSAWAALDFAPPALAEGCVSSDEWATAAAAGRVVRAEHGAVILDLDGDGFEGTGWALLYMHLEARDRVAAGARVQAGDRLGHPSCEGGVSNGTHVHLARKYNGEWIAADGAVPFVLDGWVSAGLGREYDGTLSKGGITLEACDCRAEGNEITR
jgi:LysM repeat protein